MEYLEEQIMSTKKYEPVIGLETHAELKTNSKMFCSCKNDPFGGEANTHTCPVCLGMPGALPVANKKAIEWTIKIGLALNCKINLFSKFDRKNYFYPDLPKGYQISQYDIPFCYDGYIETSEGRIGITRIHLEEDTAKLVHRGDKSLIDFNRSSVPLVEIVTEPDIKTASQAKEYGQTLRKILRFLEVANCDMEKGGMRLEANVSLRQKGETGLPNYKVEVKNINSFKFLEQAILLEEERQSEILDKGETPKQETRGYNPKTGKTFSQRTKEDAEDYRYFPDPDLPPIEFSQEQIDAIKNSLPELPEQIISRWQKDYALNENQARSLVKSLKKTKYFEKLLKAGLEEKIDLSKFANSIINHKIDFEIGDETKTVIAKFNQLFAVDEIDQSEIETAIEKVLNANPDAVAKFKEGKTQIIGFLMGQSMREISKKVDANQIRKVLLEKLK
jgi:aspartyl-tRNA(Asn)/glutamyl-tRNA(Gln) amidotransferase subunit B